MNKRTKKTKPKVAILVRTSSDDGDLERKKKRERENKKPGAPREKFRIRHKESIEEQLKLCRERCEKLGYEVVEEFVDQNLSGRTYPHGYEIPDPAFDDYFEAHIKRPNKRTRHGLGRLLDRRDIQVIVVRDIYRLFRPAFQSHLGNHIWQHLTKHNIHIHSVEDGDIDSNKFEDLMITNLKLQIADQAKRQEVEAARRSLKAKKDNGYLATGVKCYGLVSSGYQKVKKKPGELKVVRWMFDEYLKSTDISKIARQLNDKKGLRTSAGTPWTVQKVRNILLRPWYAGLQYNSQGELIESKVFPSGRRATVTPENFHRVLHSFELRKRREVQTEKEKTKKYEQENSGKPTVGGRKLGTADKRGPLHPLSGLVKCGCCGRHLYITKIVNRYFRDDRGSAQIATTKNKDGREIVLVNTYHYICKSAQTTDHADYEACKKMRIKEAYPQESLELGIEPNGLGLIECLWPLLFHGAITRYVRKKTAAPGLENKRASLQSQLDKLKERQDRLFDQHAEEIIDEEQFAQEMKRCREKKTAIQEQLDHIVAEIEILISGATEIPDEVILDPAQTSRKTIWELAHETFEEILVYPDKIRVRMKNDVPDDDTETPRWLEIPRIRRRNARNLPFWKARINTPAITPDTKVGVVYYLKSTDAGIYRQVELLYHDEHMEILTVGTNESVDKKRSSPDKDGSALSNILRGAFEPAPGYDGDMDVDQTAFFSSSIGDGDGVQPI